MDTVIVSNIDKMISNMQREDALLSESAAMKNNKHFSMRQSLDSLSNPHSFSNFSGREEPNSPPEKTRGTHDDVEPERQELELDFDEPDNLYATSERPQK